MLRTLANAALLVNGTGGFWFGFRLARKTPCDIGLGIVGGARFPHSLLKFQTPFCRCSLGMRNLRTNAGGGKVQNTLSHRRSPLP